MSKQEDKIIRKIGETTITTYPSNPKKVLITTDFREAKASTVENIVKDWVKENFKNKEVSDLNLKDFIHTIVMENRLWVTSDLQKEVESLYKKMVTKSSFYVVNDVVKNVTTHYKRIYKNKNF